MRYDPVGSITFVELVMCFGYGLEPKFKLKLKCFVFPKCQTEKVVITD